MCGSVCYQDNSKLHASILAKLHRFVGKGSDHLQLIKFWPYRIPGNGVCGGAKFLAPPYYSHLAVFASPSSTFFIINLNCLVFWTTLSYPTYVVVMIVQHLLLRAVICRQPLQCVSLVKLTATSCPWRWLMAWPLVRMIITAQ